MHELLTGDWRKRGNYFERCWRVARGMGYPAFAIQNGKCLASKDILQTYKRHGKADKDFRCLEYKDDGWTIGPALPTPGQPKPTVGYNRVSKCPPPPASPCSTYNSSDSSSSSNSSNSTRARWQNAPPLLTQPDSTRPGPAQPSVDLRASLPQC